MTKSTITDFQDRGNNWEITYINDVRWENKWLINAHIIDTGNKDIMEFLLANPKFNIRKNSHLPLELLGRMADIQKVIQEFQFV